MNYKIRFRDCNWPNSYIANFMHSCVKQIIEKFPEHNFEIVTDPSLHGSGWGTISSPLNFSILNPENDKYILVSSFDDWRNHFMPHLGWKPENMVKFFYSGGFSFLEYYSWKKIKPSDSIRDIYRPFFYGPSDKRQENLCEELYKNREVKHEKLFFRGLIFGPREQLVKIEHPDIQVINRRAGGTQKSYPEFLKEMSTYKAALSPPGMSEICNRDIECFAVGTPVFRPVFHTQYPDPLIPDYHYVNFYIDCNYNENGFPGYSFKEDINKYLIDKWNRVRKNQDYLDFVSENARNWYVKNCTFNKSVDYLVSQIRLEDLNG